MRPCRACGFSSQGSSSSLARLPHSARPGRRSRRAVPLVKETAGPSTIYGITMGVRPNRPEWKHRINKVIAENQQDINAILQSENVPVLDKAGGVIELGAAER